jgi:molybdopterin molybdotransferase
MVCFYLYARPALRKIGGYRKVGLPRIQVICGADIKVANNLTEFVRVRLERKDSEIYATPTGNQGSGILSSLSRADALLIGPSDEMLLKAGSAATALLLDPHAANDEEAFFEAR